MVGGLSEVEKQQNVTGGGETDFKLSSLGETPFFVHGGLSAVRVVCLNESFFRLWTSGNSQAWHRERNLNRI